MKNANLNIDLKTVMPMLKKAQTVVLKHAVFISIILVLLVYVFVVFQINQLANAEPSDDAATAATTSSVPMVNKKGIQQIQSLEQNNTQVQALFDQARNNPFQE